MAPKMFKQAKINESDRVVLQKMDILINAVEKIYPNTKFLLLRSFLQGLFTALGATIGLSIILAILTFIIAQLKFVPAVNQVIKDTHIEKVLPNEK